MDMTMGGSTFNDTSKFESPFESLESSFVSSFPMNAFPEPPAGQSNIAAAVAAAARRGSIGSSCFGGDSSEVEEMAPQNMRCIRFTREQLAVLERQFSECAKPTAAVRRTLADETGLSMQRVGSWFNNRRQRAKAQKKQEEPHLMYDLGADALRCINEPPSLDEPATNPATRRRRAKTNESTPRTPSRVSNTYETTSPYASPTEACYASLARSLACAAAAAVQANSVGGFSEYTHELPAPPMRKDPDQECPAQLHLAPNIMDIQWQPISAFSDWGSSRSSLAIYTPTPAGQQEDPFEYDQATTSERPLSRHAAIDNPASSVPLQLQEDFAQFQAAAEMNAQIRAFPFNLVPTSGLMKRRQMASITLTMPPPPIPRRDSCPNEFIDAFSSFNTGSHVESTSSDDNYKDTELDECIMLSRRKHGPFTFSISDSAPIPSSQPLSYPFEGEISPSTSIQITETSYSPPTPVHSHEVEEPVELPIGNVDSTFSTPHIGSFDSGKASSRVPDLDYSSPAETPESASFSKDVHAKPQLFIPFEYTEQDDEILSSFYDFQSGNSSASSGLHRRESTSFPFADLLSTGFAEYSEMKTKRADEKLEHVFEPHFPQAC